MVPALAFNDATTTNMNALNAGEHFSKIYHKLNNFSSTKKKRNFLSKSAFIGINGLYLSAISADGFILDTENHPNFAFVVPFNAESCTSIDGVDYRYNANHTGFLAICERQKTVGFGSNTNGALA